MPKIESTWLYQTWSYELSDLRQSGDYETGVYRAKRERLTEALSAITAEADKGGWEIKAVVPMTASDFVTNRLANDVRGDFGVKTGEVWGAAYAYGAAYTEGFAVLMQRSVPTPDELEIAKLQRMLLKEQIHSLREQDKWEAAAHARDMVLSWKITSEIIDEVKKWKVEKFEGYFKTREDAVFARAEHAQAMYMHNGLKKTEA